MKRLGILLALAAVFAASAAIASYTGPAMVEMDYIEGDLPPVMFDHQMHTMMAEGCVDCHHNHGQDNSRCSGCHDIGAGQFKSSVKDSFMGCQNCHGGIEPEYPDVPSLKTALHNTCFKCHRDMGSIGSSPRGCAEQCHHTGAAN